MQLKAIATVLVSSLVFAGCSLLPGNTNAPEQDSAMEAPSDPSSETMLREDAMNGEGQTDDQMVGGDAKVDGSEGMMDKSNDPDQAMMKESESVQLNMSNFTFGVEEIKVKSGEKLMVSVTNDSGTHDFVIDELAVDSGIIPEGETMEIEIPTDKPGTYEYYCSVGQHRALGMKGVLIIE